MLRTLPKAAPLPVHAADGGTLPVVLSVSGDDADHASIRNALSPISCRVVTAGTWAGAVQSLTDVCVSVVICESDVPDGTWRDVLNCLPGRTEMPAVIVTSPRADDKLWAEVLNVGGFDVVAKPFDTDELRHVLLTACLRTTVLRS